MALSSGKVVRARDAKPFPDEELYDSAFVQGILGTPQNPSAVADAGDVIRDIPRAPIARPEEPVSTPAARQTILHKWYFEKAGYTEGCPKCRSMLRNEESSKSAGHTPACRKRIEEWMQKDPILRVRLESAQNRRDRFLATEVEKGDERQGAPAETPTPAPR